jgi:16S rRNA (guanine966-N2)-methyltransferase
MRITAGEYAGRIIALPKGPHIRPTQDQVRQALFNLIGERVQGARMLDLFAGSGALGIEALSRGAAHATFVDRSGFCVAAIEANLKKLTSVPGTERAIGTWYRVSTLLKTDVLSAIRKLAVRGQTFDLVLLDPPYGEDLARKTLIVLCQGAIVSQSGWVVVESAKRDPLPPAFEESGSRLVMQRVETYGDTALTFYENSSLARPV